MQVPEKLSVFGHEIHPPIFRGSTYEDPIYSNDPSLELPPIPTTLTLEDERVHDNLSLNNSLVVTDGLNEPAAFDESIRTSQAYSSGITRQVRHLHNRVKLLEEELQTQHTRQMYLIGIMSLYFLIKGLNWIRH